MKNSASFLKESKGFCLPHFGDLIETAENKLNDAAEKGVLPEGICTDAGKYGTPAKEVAWFVRKMTTGTKIKTGEIPQTVFSAACRNVPAAIRQMKCSAKL